jgi:hypothetical protein
MYGQEARDTYPRLQDTNFFSKKCVVGYDKKCLICWDDLKEDQDTTLLSPCAHRFHKNCIQTWTGKYGHSTCPTCRAWVPDIQSTILRQKEWSKQEPRLRRLEELVKRHQVRLLDWPPDDQPSRSETPSGRLENQSSRSEPLHGRPEDRLTRLEQLVQHHEDRLRTLGWRVRPLDWPAHLEMLRRHPEDWPSCLYILEQLSLNHENWLYRLAFMK